MHSRDDHPLFKKLANLHDLLLTNTGNPKAAICLLTSWQSEGKLSVYLSYDWLQNRKIASPQMKMIWKNFIPPKFSFILCLAIRGRLCTWDKWHNNYFDRSCILCGYALETSDHLFFRCSFAHSVWKKIREWLNIRRSMNTLRSVVKWIKKDYRGALISNKAILIAFAATIYLIQKARNNKLFSGVHHNIPAILKSIQIYVYSILDAFYPLEMLTF